MWPAINQGLNVVTISTPDSGKTVGYIVPIASNIGNNEEVKHNITINLYFTEFKYVNNY